MAYRAEDFSRDFCWIFEFLRSWSNFYLVYGVFSFSLSYELANRAPEKTVQYARVAIAWLRNVATLDAIASALHRIYYDTHYIENDRLSKDLM